MYTTPLVLLLAGAAAAQSTIEVFNAFPDPTITYAASNAKATTYTRSCNPAKNATASSTQASASGGPTSSASDVDLLPISALPTPRALLQRRQAFGDDDVCQPYTLVQGPSTWELHLTRTGIMTADIDCNWSGEAKSADWTCTGTSGGAFYSTETGTSTTVFKQSDLTSIGDFQSVTVVNAPTSSSSPASEATVSSRTSSSSSGTATTGASPSSMPTGNPQQQSQSPGFGVPMPTGPVAFVGGAAGLLAAALAL